MNKAHAALARTIGNIFQGLWSPQQRDWDPRAEVSGAADERTGTRSVPEQPLPSGYTGQLWWNPPPLALCERGISLHRHQPKCNQVLPKWFSVLQSLRSPAGDVGCVGAQGEITRAKDTYFQTIYWQKEMAERRKRIFCAAFALFWIN